MGQVSKQDFGPRSNLTDDTCHTVHLIPLVSIAAGEFSEDILTQHSHNTASPNSLLSLRAHVQFPIRNGHIGDPHELLGLERRVVVINYADYVNVSVCLCCTVFKIELLWDEGSFSAFPKARGTTTGDKCTQCDASAHSTQIQVIQ